MSDYDGVVIGAGHNGLTCACYLARAGMKVLVLEAAPAIGGMTTTAELVQAGYWTDVHASGYQLASLSSAPDELALRDHGLELIRPDVALSKVFTDGSSLSIKTKLDDTCESIATHSRRDADTWRDLFAEYLSQKDRIRAELENPPRPPGVVLEELGTGRAAQQRLRSRYQSVRSWAAETFESAAMRDLLADFAGHAGFSPDDAGGAAFSLAFLSIMQDAGNRAVKGGMGKVAAALASALSAFGGEVRTSAPVRRVVVESGTAVGVQLDDGEVIRTPVIASSAHPRHLVLDLLEDAPIEPDLVRDIERYELGVSQFGIYLTLRAPITYVAAEAEGATQVHLMPPTTDGLAEAFQQVRAEQLPAVPSVFTVNEATVGTHVREVAHLQEGDLVDASLVTASALLDVLTGAELETVVQACLRARAPVLFTLSVTGEVTFDPVDPGDLVFASAFNAHQRRVEDGRRLLGPDAVSAAADLFRAAGWSVRAADSPWELDAGDRLLVAEWLDGWLDAAVEQRPALREWADEYQRLRAVQLMAGALQVAIGHRDVLAWPP